MVPLHPVGWIQLYRCGCTHRAAHTSALPMHCAEHLRFPQGEPQPIYGGQPEPVMLHLGRPTIYSEPVANLVLRLVRQGWLTRDFDRDKPRLKLKHQGYDDDEAEALAASLPGRTTIQTWRQEKPEFRVRYTQARADWLEHGGDEELLDIADDATNDYVLTEKGFALDTEHINRSKVRIATRQWLMENNLERYTPKSKVLTDDPGLVRKPQIRLTDEQLERILADARTPAVHSEK